jgi:hypothetical protein
MPIIGGRQIGVRGLGFQGAGKPSVPTSVSATDVGTGRAFNNGAANITWVAPSSNGAPITSYTVLSSPGSFTATTSSTSVQITGLQSSTSYTFTITATNAVGISDAGTSNSITATTVPQAPTIGTATVPAVTQAVDIAYTANATGGAAISTFTATSSPGSLTGTGSSPIRVLGLTNGTAYTFTVTATNVNGTSLPSAASNSATPVVPFAATGGTVVTSGGFKYHTFLSNGTFQVTGGSKTIEYIVVAGGGGSSIDVGGGGGGGFRYGTATATVNSYPATIGAGGANQAAGVASSFNSLQSAGGGSGGGGTGGSGGGARYNATGGSGNNPTTSPAQGFNGGNSISGVYNNIGGGGGGAGGAGTTSNGDGTIVGNGGPGNTSYSVWASATSTGVNGGYAGGGGGGGSWGTWAAGSANHGGGVGGTNVTSSIGGTVNTGGGSGSWQGTNSGGSGIVIVRYAE